MPRCRTCGAALEPAVQVCPACGAPTGGAGTVAVAAGPTAARRVVATFNSHSSWAGKQVVYQAPRLSVDGAACSAGKLMDYDRRAWLDWAHDGLREWLGDLAAWERSSQAAPTAALAVAPTAAPAGAASHSSAAPSTPPAAESERPKDPTRMDGPVFCPYCAVAVEPPPRATQDCPACGQAMHLKRLAGTDERRLLTDADATDNDAAWQRYHQEDDALGAPHEGPADQVTPTSPAARSTHGGGDPGPAQTGANCAEERHGV